MFWQLLKICLALLPLLVDCAFAHEITAVVQNYAISSLAPVADFVPPENELIILDPLIIDHPVETEEEPVLYARPPGDGLGLASVDGKELLIFPFFILIYMFWKVREHRKKMFIWFFCFLGFFRIQAQTVGCATDGPVPVTDRLFVKTNPVSGNGTGSSWDDAFDGKFLAWYLREKAVDGTKIYVAEGTYVPYVEDCDTLSDMRDYSFQIKKNIEFRGGYKDTSTGNDPADSIASPRNPKLYVTRLSGEIQNPAIVTDNSYHVVSIDQNKSALIDGFYISGGYANGTSDSRENGGGVFDRGGAGSQVELSHLVVEENYANFGGGLYINSNTATILREVVVQNNTALRGDGGAGIFAWGNFLLENSTVNNNLSSTGIISWGGDMLIRNSTISGNATAGFYVDNSSFGDEIRVRFEGSTVADNKNGGVLLNNKTQMRISFDNSLMVNNTGGDFSLHSGSNPVTFPERRFSIIGNTKYITSESDTMLLDVPVTLAPLANNGGWGFTHALLDPCQNPAYNSGDPLLSGQKDQRGVIRNTPPCVGAYDGLTPLFITSTWIAESASDKKSWSDPDNWSLGQVPDFCTDIVFPGGLTNYPELQESDQAVCHSIKFGMGAELARTDYLTYREAKVELAVGTNRWYTLSAPLSDMYSGDYFERNSLKRKDPITYMMKYNLLNPQTGTIPTDEQLVGFSGAFNSLFEKLTPGMGYAVWVYDGEADDDYNPYPENFQYYDFPKDSIRYYMYRYNGTIADTAKIQASGRSKRDRFIYEETQPDENGNFSIDVVQNNPQDTKALIGNPFMSHLNFTAFSAANGGLPGYYIWSGTSFDANDFVDADPIPPMQSFFISKAPGPFTVNFNLSMSVTASGSQLRSSEINRKQLKMKVIRNGNDQSYVRINYDPPVNNIYDQGRDMWTLFSESETYPAVLYALIDGKAASVHTLRNTETPVELGIRTATKGPLSILLSDMDTFGDEFNIFLEDRLAGKSSDLRQSPVFTFDNQTGNIQGRFFLRIVKVNTGLEEKTSSSGVYVYAAQGKITIKSNIGDPIRSVEVSDMQGKVLYRKNGLDTSSETLELHASGNLLLIRVQTQKTQTVCKTF